MVDEPKDRLPQLGGASLQVAPALVQERLKIARGGSRTADSDCTPSAVLLAPWPSQGTLC